MYIVSLGGLVGKFVLEVGRATLHGVVLSASGVATKRAIDAFFPDPKESKKEATELAEEVTVAAVEEEEL